MGLNRKIVASSVWETIESPSFLLLAGTYIVKSVGFKHWVIRSYVLSAILSPLLLTSDGSTCDLKTLFFMFESPGELLFFFFFFKNKILTVFFSLFLKPSNHLGVRVYQCCSSVYSS